MTQVPVQVNPGGILGADFASKVASRAFELGTALVSGATNQSGATVTLNANDQSLFIALNTDATAGTLTLTLEGDAGSGFNAYSGALYVGGDVSVQNVPDPDASTLALDMTDTDNQGTVVLGVSGSARQLDSNGNLVAPLPASVRLDFTTSVGYDGTVYTAAWVTNAKRHQPLGSQGPV